MLRSLFLKLMIYLGLKQEQRFLRLLAKLEYGVSIFCLKMAVEAKKEGHDNLAILLEKHASDENKHGKMLASLVDGRQRVTPLLGCVGRWLEINRIAKGEQLDCAPPDEDAKGRQIVWDSVNFPGEQIQGVFENFDGLSQRYFSLRLLFGGLNASSFAWNDRLAFMIALESETQKFYYHLANSSASVRLRAIATLISNDEENHADYLHYALFNFSYFPSDDINKWKNRLSLARWGLVVDIGRFLIGH